MTDHEIIQRLIARDNHVTEEFFFVKCRPLFHGIIRKVFDYEVDYNEVVNELYLYLMADDATKLKSFKYRSSVYQWLKVIAIRYFIKRRNRLIENSSQETPYEEQTVQLAEETDCYAYGDLQRLLSQMPNRRYALVIQRLVIDEVNPEELAKEMTIETANLYNIKRRAMAQLAQVALNDIRRYGK